MSTAIKPRVYVRRKKVQLSAIPSRVVVWVIMVSFALFSVIPMTWLILAPSKTQVQLQQDNAMSFGSFQGYADSWNNLMLFQDGRLVTWLFNSVWYLSLIHI